MSIIYRKSLKGIDEVAFKSTGLPMWLMSYLLAVDGESTVDQLAARNTQLPSLAIVLQGLQEQGFVEVANAASAANVVDMTSMRMANGTSGYAPSQQPAFRPAPAPQQFIPQQGFVPELENVKATMMRDVSSILGADATPVMQKIQGCRTKDELFTTMMGIKKIVLMYSDRAAADKFAARYNTLAN